jgi:hypothetical protein
MEFGANSVETSGSVNMLLLSHYFVLNYLQPHIGKL